MTGVSQVNATIYVVEDDPVAAAFAAAAAQVAGWPAKVFSSAEPFLTDIAHSCRGCLILDLQMEGMTGLQLQSELKERGCLLPVIVVSGQADVPTAVAAMKQAAFDYFEKPVALETLAASIRRAVAFDATQSAGRADAEIVQARFARLSPRERQVMGSVVAGMANKQIAAKLGLSEKTIEVHRGSVMRKMQVESVPDLVRASLLCMPAESTADQPAGR